MRSSRRCSFVILNRDDQHYLQAGGSTAGCLLEWRDGGPDRHWRAWQDPPVVPFEDGTTLHVGGGQIPLQRSEWFRLDQATEVFDAYLDERPFPVWLNWRSIADVFTD